MRILEGPRLLESWLSPELKEGYSELLRIGCQIGLWVRNRPAEDGVF
jgi:hypothetical protein